MNPELIAAALMAGLIGTTGMTAFAQSFYYGGALHYSPVQAIGSWVTGSTRQSQSIGWAFHYTAGIVFALLYAALIQSTGVTQLGIFAVVAFTSLLGFWHGLVVSFLVVITVGEHHPLRKFRPDGIDMAIIYFAAHVVYGFLVGATIAASASSAMMVH